MHSTRNQRWIVAAVAAVLLCASFGSSAFAMRVRSEGAPQGLKALWAKLDAARAYRCQLGSPCPTGGQGDTENRCRRKDLTQLVLDYRTLPGAWVPPSPADPYGQTPEEIFQELVGPAGFETFLADTSWGEEARWGLQESLNELMAGQLALGNQSLLRGLRTRFPGTGDPADPDQLTSLTNSVSQFDAGTTAAIMSLRADPAGLRARDVVVPTFPFWVENAAAPGGLPPGEVVESDLHRLTEIVYRRGVANNALGRRKFFFGNADPTGRQEAADELKRSAQATYLNTALLAAVQSEEDFQNNNGYELKRQVTTAQKIFDDIVAGFNPLKLLGDFVPRDAPEPKIANAVDLMKTARTAEADANNFSRQYDEDQTALSSELLTQQTEFLDRISELTGIISLPDLTDPDIRTQFFADVEQDIENCSLNSACQGELGSLGLAVLLAEVDSRDAYEKLRSIPELIRNEEERQNAVSRIILENGEAQAVATTAIQIATAVSVDCCSIDSGTSTNFGQIATAGIAGSKELLAAVERADIEGINSAATIKDLLLQQVQALIAVERAGLEREARRAELRGAEAELQRVVRNYVGAQQNLACAYFSNPAYRLQQSQAQRTADLTFEAAMVQSYFAAKSLEYEWSERLENPISCSQPDCPRPIGQSPLFDGITRAESVFASRSAGSAGAAEPALDTFLAALKQWDLDLRGLRLPTNDGIAPFTFSVRRDILGFESDGSPAEEELSILRFRDFIAENRVPGTGAVDDVVFTFAIQIANQNFFPAEPNLKLKSVSVNLEPKPNFPLNSGGPNAPLVRLIMRDIATLRTFFADYQGGMDDLLQLDIEESGTLESSRFSALFSASIDGVPAIPANTTLQNLSPAVTRWTLKIDMEQSPNQDLILENLADVDLTFEYRINAPPPVTFPDLN